MADAVLHLQVRRPAFEVEREVADQSSGSSPTSESLAPICSFQRPEKKIRLLRRFQSQSPSLLPSAASAYLSSLSRIASAARRRSVMSRAIPWTPTGICPR